MLNRVIIGALVLIILMMVAERFWVSSQAKIPEEQKWRDSLEMATQLDPGDLEMMYAYGYSQQGHVDKALFWMGRAALIDPQDF